MNKLQITQTEADLLNTATCFSLSAPPHCHDSIPHDGLGLFHFSDIASQ